MNKSNTLMYPDIVDSVKTIQEINELVLEIDGLLENLFKSDKHSFEKALVGINFDTAEKIKQIFLQKKLDLKDKEGVKNFLETLKDELNKLKVIKVTLACEWTIKTVNRICNWIKENLGKGYVLDINRDETVLGGAIIVFNGKYKDITLKKRLTETFEEKRKEILLYK